VPSSRSHRSTRVLILAVLAGLLPLFASEAVAATDSSERRAVTWNGRTFESAYELRRHVARRGRSFERFARSHPRIVARLGLKPLRWSGRRFYTPRAMHRWLVARDRSYARWRARYRAASALLRANARLSTGRAPAVKAAAKDSAPLPSASSPVPRKGIAAGGNMHNLTEPQLAREFDEYVAAGAHWARIDINWAVIQHQGPTSYNWEPFDRVVRAARARGLWVMATILYTPAWARPGTNDARYPPVDLGAFASFAAAAVSRYAPLGVRHWEVWNEPNIVFWMPQPDPARYTEMLKLAYRAIKGADANAFVISAGLSPYGAYGETRNGFMNPLTFLERMYTAGARGHFDALGFHPYNFGGLFYHPASAWSQLVDTTPNVRSIMTANGDAGKSVWATEFGAPTGAAAGAISEAAQAAMVSEGYAKWSAWPWAGPLLWYSFRDTGTNVADREHNFGIIRHDYTRKLSFAAYHAAAR